MTHGSWFRSRKLVVMVALAAAATLGGARYASSRIAGGHGSKGDCYAEFDNITSSRPTGQPRVDCEDGDPTCDSDGDCHNGSCTVKVGVCINQSDITGCTPPTAGLKKLKALPGKYKSLTNGLDLTKAVCSTTLTDVVVKTTKKGKKPGKQQLRLFATAGKPNKPPVDSDVVTIFCNPRPAGETCPVGTTTTSTVPGGGSTTTTVPPTCNNPAPCTCAGGAPTRLSFTTTIGAGDCGHLDADGNPNFFPLKCGGLYFGGAGVGVPLPSVIPDQGVSLVKTVCSASTLCLSNTTSVDTGSNRNCTSVGCLFGPPLPIPNGSHNGAATSTCVINTVSQNATGTADCSTGSTTQLNLPLSSGLFLTGDSLPNRCSGGTTPGAGCSPAGSACPGGGTCVNDTGRCANNGNVCDSDTDCAGSTCEKGACAGGANAGHGCILDSDCPGSSCTTFIQPCPICNDTTHLCNGGPNDGLACTPGDSAVNGQYPTSHDCPPSPANALGTLPIGFLLDSGTLTKTSVDLPGQPNVFCGFCRNKITNAFKNPAVPCTADAQCAGVTSFTSCGQRTSGAFTSNDVARTIVATGAPAGALTTGGPGAPAKIVSIFCIPPTFNNLVDSAADLPGPGATTLQGVTQLLP